MPVAMMTGSMPRALPPRVASASRKLNLPITSESWLVPPKAIPMAMTKPAPHTIGIMYEIAVSRCPLKLAAFQKFFIEIPPCFLISIAISAESDYFSAIS